jgi:DNA (cytosine-5)-methyltransferase 1
VKPILLDLFCGAGGAAMGYHRAGFEVIGVDIVHQKHYPFGFIHADALEVLERVGRDEWWRPVVAIHASPPCQAYTNAQRIQAREHPDLIEPTRDLLDTIGKPYVIENVPGAPLLDPIMLCGAMFPELNVYRHRLFETNWPLEQPLHPIHIDAQTKMGRPPVPGERMQVVGNFSGVAQAREAMGIDWMTRNELSESIPPAYTEWVGERLMAQLALEMAA